MTKRIPISWPLIGVTICLAIAAFQGCLRQDNPANVFEQATHEDQGIAISPDYQGVTIPYNIAPLNFKVLEPAQRYLLKIHAPQGDPLWVTSTQGNMRIPMQDWHSLLAQNQGQSLTFEVALCNPNGRWIRRAPWSIHIAEQPIDPYLAYRRLKAQFNWFLDLGIYQRNLEDFTESLILHGRSFKNGCLNCHSFQERDPQHMTLGIRSSDYGVGCLYIENGTVDKIGTKFGHTCWHPSGKVIAYSAFDVRIFFHTATPDVQDVMEMDSMLAYYRADKENVATTAVLADPKRLETQPTWSPDGTYLYFASAPKLWTDMEHFPPDNFTDLRYDIQRIPYNVDTDTWGKIETVVSAEQTGKSCLMPRISPDGRFLLFSQCDYGCFPIYLASTDLYIKDLMNNGDIHKLSCNSEFTDSWHTWSSNSRWIVFSSKRPTGRFTRLYISFIDEHGKASKPFVLPQKNPEFYDSMLYIYNLPELISGPVTVSQRHLIQAVRSSYAIEVDALTGATPKAGPWKDKVDSR